MSKTVDERVVSMQFDNAQFERNVKETMSTIDKLKQQLTLLDSTKGFENIGKSAKNVDLSSLSNSVDKVGIRFNALHTIADQALRRITDSALYAGQRIVSALTIDPVKMGFSEYETQINAIQTILANTESKGTTLNDVNGALDELNAYADKTIYNFTEMTRNIGTFTAAGVDLDTSVSAIKGIANLAAVSGSNSQQASMAMYQLSQALSSGTVKLMDWNSVVNAGMGGQVFQDALKETARVHGIAIDDLIKKEGSFRETLQHGWLSSEILTETLSKFTGDLTAEQLKSMGYTEKQIQEIQKLGQTANDAATKVKTFSQLIDTLKEAAQSGWTQTWEIIVGDFEEAKGLWTSVSDTISGMIGSAAEARNELLENWKVLGGRDDLLQSFVNIFEAIKSFVKPISEAFRDIFPPMTADRLVKITEGLKNFTEKLKLSDEASDNLKRTFKGLFAIVDIFKIAFTAVVKACSSLFGTVGKLGGGILGVTASFGDWLVLLRNWIRDSDIFNKTLQGVVAILKAAFKGVSVFAKFIKDKIVSPGMEVFRTLLEKVSDSMSGVVDTAGTMRDGVVDAFDKMGTALEQCSLFKIIESVWNGLVKITTAIAGVVGSLIGGFFNKLGNGDFQGIIDFITGLISGGIGVALIKFINDVGSVFDGFGEIFEGLGDCLSAFQAKLKAEALLKIGQAIALLAASLLVLSLIDPEKMGVAIGAITTLFTELLVAMRVITSFNKNKGLLRITLSIVGIAASMLLLAAAMKILSTMSWSEMGVGLISMVAGLTAMVVAIRLLPETKVNKAAATIRKLSTAMLILAVAIKIMSTMSWSEMGVGLISMVVGLTAMVAAVRLLPTAKVTKAASAIRRLSTAMLILAVAIKIMSTMSWSEMGVGLVSMAAGLAAMVVAIRLLPKSTSVKALGMVTLATSLVVLAGALKIMATMSWEDFAKGMATLGGSITILAIGLRAMKGTLSGSVAMLVATSALAVLAPILLILGSLSWSAIAKGLVAIAGAFAVVGIAGAVLAPVLPSILGLAGALILVGAAVLAAGVGLAALAAGLTALSIAFVAISGSIGLITVGIVKIVEAFIVGIISGIGKGIVAICRVIIDGASSIGEAVKTIILTLCDVISECVPTIANTILKVIVGLLDSLSTYTPQIVSGLFNFIIGVIDALAEKIPEFVKSVFNLISSIFTGVIEALKSIDPDALLKGVLSVTLIAVFMKTLASLAKLGPAAMKGVLVFGVVLAELSLVLAALGAIAKIPGLHDLINEGGKLLQNIGTAIGSFIGGIIGGIAKGVTNTLPEVGNNLSMFMTNLQPFITGVQGIDSSLLTSVKNLAEAIMLLTAANLFDRITSFVTGGSSIASFGKELAKFGESFKEYSNSVSGIDPHVVMASATAAKALTEVANNIPNSGGVVSWFAGDNSIAQFGEELTSLGEGLKGFSDSVEGINPEGVVSSANAAKALVEMTNTIPNSGGVASWFAGDNSVAQFSEEIISLGKGLKGFSEATIGIDPEAIIAASKSAKALAEMTTSIPNSGGVSAWFSGDNSISHFAEEIPKLGKGLKGFSDSVAGIAPDSIIAAANAAKAISEMTNTIPNSGGVVSWFAGDNSITQFAEELPKLGSGLKGFANAVTGINPESTTAAANAAKSLAEMTNAIPNEGGVVSWFSGERSVSKFAGELVLLGMGLKGFADQTAGINPETVTAASTAAKNLADMTNAIPNEGGMVSWFAGEQSVSKFAADLMLLGMGLKGFADQTVGINPESTIAAANSAKALAEMTQHIPNEGGVVSWFTGEQSISKFAGELPKLGEGLKGFSTSVEGINAENITAAANSAKALAEMTQYIPKEGGIAAWFTGETSIANFAGKLPTLGKGLKGFSDSVEGINTENLTAAAKAAEAIAKMTANTLDNVDQIPTLATNLSQLGSGMKKCFGHISEIPEGSLAKSTEVVGAIEKMGSVNGSSIQTTATAIEDVTKAIQNLSKVPKDAASNFNSALSELGSSSADALLKAFKDIEPDMKSAGETAMNSFINGLEGKSSAAKTAAKKVASAAVDAIGESKKTFTSAGSDLVDGFASGISANSYKAEAKARAMAQAAAQAAREALAINSPSKVFREIGYSIPEGLAVGIDRMSRLATNSSEEMAISSVDSVKDTLYRISNAINADMDTQPTIRPVLDLSDVRAGANSISSLFNRRSSVGVMTNVNAINSSMNRNGQNGANDQLASEIDKLNKSIKNMEHVSYNINGVSFTEGSDVEEAFRTILRAAKIERRV